MIDRKILITGASGFIGTNVLEYFHSMGYIVINFDLITPKNNEHISFWEKIDITKYDDLYHKAKIFNPNYIIHLAARTDLKGKTLDDYSANIIGVKNIIKVSQQLPNLKKIIIASSMLVCSRGYKPQNQFDYNPVTIYGESKVLTEKIVWNNKPYCDWAIIRPTSIWGEWFGSPYKDFFDMIIAKHYFHIGSKSCAKTYGYIGNSVYQIERILFYDTADENNKIFYIGDHPATNIQEWGNEIAKELNIKILKVPYFIFKLLALSGDIFALFGLHIPMTSYRLKNMTINNIVDLTNTYNIAPNPPFSRIEGIRKTLKWMNLFS
jgi:nucleoside-diphosphate-sugar epimerase